jgi:predicted RNA polymerase sigma factor
VPLAEQDRERWDPAMIAEGQAILTATLGVGPVGPYQIQAAIAAVHDEARTAQETDWPQILALYDVLADVAPGPLVTLSRAVAVAMVHGPKAGLALLGTLETDDRMAHTHRLLAVRAHLLERAGETAAARESYLRAARMTASLPEQRYLIMCASRFNTAIGGDPPAEEGIEGDAQRGTARQRGASPTWSHDDVDGDDPLGDGEPLGGGGPPGGGPAGGGGGGGP